MAIEKRTLEIGEYTYEVTQLDAIKGRKTFVKLANAIGPAFRMATSEKAMFGNLLCDLKSEDLDAFCELFGATSTVTGGEYVDRAPNLTGKTFMEHFAGNYLAMFEWLGFCVTTNYGSFFDGIEGLIEKYRPKAAPVLAAEKTPES